MEVRTPDSVAPDPTGPGLVAPEPAAPQTAAAGRPWYVSALLALAAVALLLGGVWGYTRLKSPYPFFGTAYDARPAAATFAGTDQEGRAFAFTPDGKTTTALFFGFTHCPNICPLSLSYLGKVRQSLPEAERENFRVMMVSVDPDRDTPERLREYATFFGQATAVNVPEPQLAGVARAYGVGYEKADVQSPGDYQINHTTASYLIDRSGKLRVLWDYSQLPQVERVAADVRYVMENPAP
ncbi:SCO family protein [Deinococcus petrolearius]|uniref:SCO family protein n=1 Tax=Deinococcus petrolearius TaxID=1751295 RepID=A0ABW1DI98_9DEIO